MKITTAAGYEIIASKPARNDGHIIIASVPGHHPFVTWWMDNVGHCFHGHYFFHHSEAVHDFNKRT
jgi:Mn-containing catalase